MERGGRADSSCGRGGTGGGVGEACSGTGGGRWPAPLAMTGGSFAKMSRRMARKSRIFDFYVFQSAQRRQLVSDTSQPTSQKSAQPTRYGW